MESFLVLSIPRSKSTFLYRLLFFYHQKKYNNECSWLGYYFDTSRYNRFYTNNVVNGMGVVDRNHYTSYVDGAYREVPRINNNNLVYINREYKDTQISEELHLLETERRANLLLKYPGRYFIKHYYSPHSVDIFLPLIENDINVICIERRDILSQFLEYTLSVKIGRFQTRYPSKYLYPEQGSIKIKKSYVKLCADRHNEYKDWIKKSNNTKIVDHDNLKSVQDAYDCLGITDWQDVLDVDYIEKNLWYEPSYNNIEQYFENMEQVEKWVNELYKS